MSTAVNQTSSEKIAAACIEAIIRSTIDPETRVAMLRSDEVCRALMRIMATLAATSRETETPRGLRLMTDKFAKQLRLMIIAARDVHEREGSPFDSVMHQSDVH